MPSVSQHLSLLDPPAIPLHLPPRSPPLSLRKHAVLPSPRLHRPPILPLPYSTPSFFFTSSRHCMFPMSPALPRLFNSPLPLLPPPVITLNFSVVPSFRYSP